MAKQFMDIEEVARSLHVSTREVVRMAEQRILPAARAGNQWRFRTGEVWNWIEENLHSLSERRSRDRHPELADQLLISAALRTHGVELNLDARTKVVRASRIITHRRKRRPLYRRGHAL